MPEPTPDSEPARAASPGQGLARASAKRAAGRSRRWLLWTVVLVVVAAACWGLAASGVDWRVLIEQHPQVGAVIFAVLMAFLPLVGFPISAFYVFAGLAFPVPVALVAGGTGLAVNMSLGYLLARGVWREPLQRRLEARWPRLFQLDEKACVRLTLLVRAVPGVPFTAQNYLLGVLAVPFGLYLALSWGIQFVFLTGMVLTTRGVIDHDGELALMGGLAVLVAVVGLRLGWRWWKRRSI